MSKVPIVILVMMLLAVTCSADQQADFVARLRANPTENFSQPAHHIDDTYFYLLLALGEADAIVYFQDRKDIDENLTGYIGKAHAFKHHLIGNSVDYYGEFFSRALDAVLADRREAREASSIRI
jgi:hypothetical protein